MLNISIIVADLVMFFQGMIEIVKKILSTVKKTVNPCSDVVEREVTIIMHIRIQA